jgi:tetratricopeptide (TPR) repeat protein
MPGNRQVYDLAMKRGHGFARQQAWDKAAAEYQRALAEFPEDADALIAAGAVLINLKLLPEALAVLQHANQARPNDLLTMERLADVQAQLSYPADAAQTYAAIGNLLAEQGNTDQAVETWKRASNLDASNLEAHQKLAEIYQAQSNTKASATEWITVARIFRRQGDWDKAALQCQAALALDPRNTDALRLMEGIRVKRGTGMLPPLPEPSPAGALALPSPAAPPTPPPGASGIALAPDEEEGAKPGSPVDLAAEKALSNLAESLFEEEALPTPSRPGVRLTKAEIDTLISQAIDLQTRGQAQQAIAAYKRVLDVMDLPAARFNLGLLYEQELLFEEAVEQFQQSIHDPEYALGSRFALGECCRARGQIDAALEHFVQVLKIVDLATVKREQVDDLIALYENLADSFVTKGDRDQAIQFTNSLVDFLSSRGWEDKVVEARQRLDSLTGEDAPILSLAEILAVPNAEVILQSLALTQEYAKRGKLYSALEEAYLAIEHAPDFLPMHRSMADILWNGGHEESATAKYMVIADAYQGRGDSRHAIGIYQYVLRLTPMDVQTRFKLIDLLISHGEIDKALEQYMALADTYYQLAELDKAREKFQEAMTYVPRASDSKHWTQQILHRVADIDMQRIDWRRATKSYEQLKSIVPDDEKARLALVELHFKTGDSARAIRELDDLLVRYSKSGKARKIIPVLEDQIRIHPNEMGLRTRMARAYIGAGLTAQAIEQLDSLGDLQLQAGFQKEAAATIRIIIALNPPNVEEYRQALAQIVPGGSA